jgi:hypothetical protein
MDDAFVRVRRQQLDTYVQKLTAEPALRRAPAWDAALDLNDDPSVDENLHVFVAAFNRTCDDNQSQFFHDPLSYLV